MKMAYLYISWLCLIQTVLVVLVDKSEAKISAVIVFGDSSVDSGNNNFIPTIARSNFEPYGRDFQGGQPTGRFSNGRIPPDFISEAVGLKPTIPAYLDPAYNISDFASGVCFASAGTGYDNATSDVLVSNQIIENKATHLNRFQSHMFLCRVLFLYGRRWSTTKAIKVS